jgi:hypothetical protein
MALRHHSRFDARDRKRRRAFTCLGIDRPRHVDQIADAKAVRGEPAVRGLRVGDGKSRQMQPGVLVQHRVELAGKRRIGGLEQHLCVSALEHGGDVAGSGRALPA